MENEQVRRNGPGLAVKICVPVLIALAVIAVWILKNRGEADSPADINPDFALDVTSDFDLEALSAYGLPIVLDFSAGWCQPCREMEPTLKKLNEELQGKAIIRIVDTEVLPEITADYPIRAIPTQFFFTADGLPFNPDDPEAMRLMIYTARDTGDHALTAHEGLMTESALRAVLREMGVEA
ncbi:MAG: thioredoxin family protein [Oscillospiraceae bacterium]|jgi:thioredoxin 1|nr:thioredoxin family protein [Oscillospiraceae bacterium]